MSTLLYRTATPADADAIAAIGRATFIETFGHLYQPADLDAYLQKSFGAGAQAGELADPAMACCLALLGEVPVGFAQISPPALDFAPHGRQVLELKRLYVSAAHHDRGIGAHLMAWCLDELRRRGADDVVLSVWEDNHRAQAFYRRHGFSVVGVNRFMVGDQADNDLIMHAPLGHGPASAISLWCGCTLSSAQHGFLGRTGGVSAGIFASLNTGTGSSDDPATVQENRRRAVAAVAPGCQLVTAYQVHSARAVLVDAPWPDDARPEADALVTATPGIALGILTADCAPVLLQDKAAGVVAAAHAGWKGALHGIIPATVSAMQTLGARPERICAAVGPCIGQSSYEVDAAFQARFVAADAAYAAFFATGVRTGHVQFDLPGFVADQLARSGVRAIHGLGLDTCADSSAFFSYRRTTLAGEKDYGRQISIIAPAAV